MPQTPPPPPKRILFACTYNRIRSPMAAALMTALYPNQHQVDSCGVAISDAIGDGFTIAVMQEVGIDLTQHTAQDVASLDLDNTDMIICLSETSYEKICAMRGKLHQCDIHYWSIYDPDLLAETRANRLAGYRAVREALRTRLIQHFGTPLTDAAKISTQ
ncbi:MAG: low molecular weight phosphatase family protein [Proteobacteria bacterium]|nr:low molecular weight phosphatase family protein [Pseudomonadota bacterium]